MEQKSALREALQSVQKTTEDKTPKPIIKEEERNTEGQSVKTPQPQPKVEPIGDLPANRLEPQDDGQAGIPSRGEVPKEVLENILKDDK